MVEEGMPSFATDDTQIILEGLARDNMPTGDCTGETNEEPPNPDNRLDCEAYFK